MTDRDQDYGSRQAGGYRSDDNTWDSSRQANQWQSDTTRQTGSGTKSDNQRTNVYNTDEGRQGRYAGGGQIRTSWDSAGRGTDEWSERVYNARAPRGYGEHRDRGDYGRDRDYRFSGNREQNYPTPNYDASGGNDFANFTSEDFGGRDFSRGGSALSGGAAPSNSYRPSWGPDSWSSRDDDRDSGKRDYGQWREYGRHRGFLDKAGDEIASWFGNEDAARRREQDHRGRGPSDYTRSDDRIREDVNDALTNDWRLDASHVRVTVKDGEVTLEGTVSSRQDKRRAEDLADDVTGAKHVQNNLRVQDGAAQSRLTAGTSTPGYSHTSTTGTSTSGSGTSATGSTSASSASTGTSDTTT